MKPLPLKRDARYFGFELGACTKGHASARRDHDFLAMEARPSYLYPEQAKEYVGSMERATGKMKATGARNN
jgi:hypothetical protein